MWDDRWLAALERITLALFVLATAVTLVERVGWGPEWWPVAEAVCGIAFGLVLMVFLNVGGAERVAGNPVGAVALALLAVIVLASIAEGVFDIDSTAWKVAQDVVITGLVVCVVAYVVVRYRATRT
jgi:hypothetical protein